MVLHTMLLFIVHTRLVLVYKNEKSKKCITILIPTEMKKAITLAIVTMISITSFCQQQKPVAVAPKSDTVYVDLSKAKVILLLDSANAKQPVKTIYVQVIASNEAVYATRQYWYNLLRWMKSGRNGDFSQMETEQLQAGFIQYAAEYERMLQQMQAVLC